MPEKNGNGEQQVSEWDESAYQLSGARVDFARGGVQVVGKHGILVQDVSVTIPFPDLLSLMGSIFALMDARQPAHMVVRKALLGEGEPALANELRARIDERQLSLVPPR